MKLRYYLHTQTKTSTSTKAIKWEKAHKCFKRSRLFCLVKVLREKKMAKRRLSWAILIILSSSWRNQAKNKKERYDTSDVPIIHYPVKKWSLLKKYKKGRTQHIELPLLQGIGEAYLFFSWIDTTQEVEYYLFPLSYCK